jgi:hypothetical protein
MVTYLGAGPSGVLNRFYTLACGYSQFTVDKPVKEKEKWWVI